MSTQIDHQVVEATESTAIEDQAPKTEEKSVTQDLGSQVDNILKELLDERLSKAHHQLSTMDKHLAEVRKEVTLLKKPLQAVQKVFVEQEAKLMLKEKEKENRLKAKEKKTAPTASAINDSMVDKSKAASGTRRSSLKSKTSSAKQTPRESQRSIAMSKTQVTTGMNKGQNAQSSKVIGNTGKSTLKVPPKGGTLSIQQSKETNKVPARPTTARIANEKAASTIKRPETAAKTKDLKEPAQSQEEKEEIAKKRAEERKAAAEARTIKLNKVGVDKAAQSQKVKEIKSIQEKQAPKVTSSITKKQPEVIKQEDKPTKPVKPITPHVPPAKESKKPETNEKSKVDKTPAKPITKKPETVKPTTTPKPQGKAAVDKPKVVPGKLSSTLKTQDAKKQDPKVVDSANKNQEINSDNLVEKSEVNEVNHKEDSVENEKEEAQETIEKPKNDQKSELLPSDTKVEENNSGVNHQNADKLVDSLPKKSIGDTKEPPQLTKVLDITTISNDHQPESKSIEKDIEIVSQEMQSENVNTEVKAAIVDVRKPESNDEYALSVSDKVMDQSEEIIISKLTNNTDATSAEKPNLDKPDTPADIPIPEPTLNESEIDKKPVQSKKTSKTPSKPASKPASTRSIDRPASGRPSARSIGQSKASQQSSKTGSSRGMPAVIADKSAKGSKRSIPEHENHKLKVDTPQKKSKASSQNVSKDADAQQHLDMTDEKKKIKSELDKTLTVEEFTKGIVNDEELHINKGPDVLTNEVLETIEKEMDLSAHSANRIGDNGMDRPSEDDIEALLELDSQTEITQQSSRDRNDDFDIAVIETDRNNKEESSSEILAQNGLENVNILDQEDAQKAFKKKADGNEFNKDPEELDMNELDADKEPSFKFSDDEDSVDPNLIKSPEKIQGTLANTKIKTIEETLEIKSNSINYADLPTLGDDPNSDHPLSYLLSKASKY